MVHQVSSLFDPKKRGMGPEIGTRQAELPDAAADIQDLYSLFRCQECRGLADDVERRPMHLIQLPQSGRIQLAKAFLAFKKMRQSTGSLNEIHVCKFIPPVKAVQCNFVNKKSDIYHF